MRTQAPTQYYQPATLSNIDILLKVLLPAFFIRTSLADFTQNLIHKGPINSECPLRQFKCKNGRCVQLAWMCDGANDCGDNSDETAAACTNLFSCSTDQFTCRSGFCIPLAYHCDKERDCPDGSDEGVEICGVGKCEKDQFQCAPEICIPNSWVCNGNADCSDGKDELNCNKTCLSNEFSCGNGECIPQKWVCDSSEDCSNGFDEKDCTASQKSLLKCSEADFQCASDKTCITKKWRCDGDFDCSDHSDEEDCPTPENNHLACGPGEFACPDRSKCIRSFLLCDGDPDCPDAGDESPEVCFNVTCRPTQFRCQNHQCIENHKRCDGQKDCYDGSDENNCLDSCKKDEFNCGNGVCIPLNKVCDKHVDCPFAEDEPRGKCGINECQVKNGGCADICVDTITGYYCDCHPGYKLVNNFTCMDIDECENPGSCSQTCLNTNGSFSCECLNGYIKDPLDSTHCIANHSHQPSLIFSRRSDIRQISLDGKNMSIIVNDTNSSAALDFLFKTSEIFWSDKEDNKIYKASIHAGNVRTVVVDNVDNCEGLAVDWIYKNIYWTDTGKKTIEMSNYEGNMRKTLINDNLGEPRAVVVNPLDGWMYWSDWGNDGRIERAGLDGSNRRKIVSIEVRWPNGLTLDLVRSRLYWVDAKTNVISSVNFDGSKRSLILKSEAVLHHPFSVSVFEDSIFWTDWDKQTIFKANKFNGSNITTITDVRMLQNPMVVHVYHPFRQPNDINLCTNRKCSHLCLPAPRLKSEMPKVNCACPDGLSLLRDGITCTSKLPSSGPGSADEGTSPTAEVPVIIDNDQVVNDGMSFYVISGVVILVLAAILFSYAALRYYRSKNVNRITFDCSPYIKPGDDLIQVKKPLDKNLIGPFDEESQEPLRRPGTNSFL